MPCQNSHWLSFKCSDDASSIASKTFKIDCLALERETLQLFLLLHHLNLMALFFSSASRKLIIADSFCSAFVLQTVLSWSWDETIGSCPDAMKSGSCAWRLFSLLISAKARFTRHFRVLFDCKVRTVWSMDSGDRYIPEYFFSLVVFSADKCTFSLVLETENEYSVCVGHKQNRIIVAKSFPSYRGTPNSLRSPLRLRQHLNSSKVIEKWSKNSLQQDREMAWAT